MPHNQRATQPTYTSGHTLSNSFRFQFWSISDALSVLPLGVSRVVSGAHIRLLAHLWQIVAAARETFLLPPSTSFSSLQHELTGIEPNLLVCFLFAPGRMTNTINFLR